MTEKFLKIWKDSAFKDVCDNLFWGVSEATGSLWFRKGAEPGLVVQGLDSEHRMEEESTSVQVKQKGLSLWLSNLFQSMMTAFCLSVTRGKHRTELSLLRSSARGKTANTKPKASLWSCPFLIPSIFFLPFPPLPSSLPTSLWCIIFPHLGNLLTRSQENSCFVHPGNKEIQGTSPLSPWWTQIMYSNRSDEFWFLNTWIPFETFNTLIKNNS